MTLFYCCEKVIKCLFFFWCSDEYRIKPVEEVKYMKNGAEEEQKIAARNQENLVRLHFSYNSEFWWYHCNKICTACFSCNLHTGTRFLENTVAIYSLPGSHSITPVSCLFLNKPFFNLDREHSRGKYGKIISVLKWLTVKEKAWSRIEIYWGRTHTCFSFSPSSTLWMNS